jgi:PIN domain nuclease of toxin-antitoxin system
MFLDTSKISKDIQGLLVSVKNEIYYSQASLWEISIKYSLGKLFLNGITPERLYGEIGDSFLLCKKLDNNELVSSYNLPREHKDPFDRIIIWQAIRGDMVLLSVDTKMDAYERYGLKLYPYKND